MDSTSLLTVPVSKDKNITNTISENDQTNFDTNFILDHDYISTASITSLTPFIEDVTEYIAGFVVKQIKRKISCAICTQHLEANDTLNLLLLKKDRGKLIKPSKDVVYICTWSEKFIRQRQNDIFKPNMKTVIINNVVQRVFPYVLLNMNDHILSQEPFDNHKKQLIVCITEHYINV